MGARSTELTPPRVLVVDDDPLVGPAHARVLSSVAAEVVVESDARDALERLKKESFDVVVSDIRMPRMSGTELLAAFRQFDLDLPVVFVTGEPTVESAAAAVELGAFRYLSKPVAPQDLRRVVLQAAHLRALARAQGDGGARERVALEQALRNAIAGLRMVYQPIVACATRGIVAYEALMRSAEPSLPHPPAVLDAAERLGALHVVGRHVRGLVASDAERAPDGTSLFVNLHSADLADPELYDPSAPLSRHAGRVVLEITERASLEGIGELDARLGQLREMGYRLAVDDLGAGYAGLSYFARLRPELVKIDMSLVRNVDADPVKRSVVASLVGLATSLEMLVVAEGVENARERDVLAAHGCTYLQGYGLARPGPPYPEATWI